jgi:hypothetical protein
VNGGMAAGMLACPAVEAATREGIALPVVTRISARLHSGIRHSADLRAQAIRADGVYEVAVHDGDATVISGRIEVASLGGAPRIGDAITQAPPNLQKMLDGMATVVEPMAPPFFEQTGDHPIAGCFSCGPRNTRGLHVFPRFADAEAGVTWASWAPEGSFLDAPGLLAQSIIASALDCSSGICLPRAQQEELLRTDQFYLLGSFDVRFLRVADPSLRYHVVAQAQRRDGRKFYGVSALFDDAGAAYATAEAIWIIVQMTRTQAFGRA